jgi:hypothetical protein
MSVSPYRWTRTRLVVKSNKTISVSNRCIPLRIEIFAITLTREKTQFVLVVMEVPEYKSALPAPD